MEQQPNIGNQFFQNKALANAVRTALPLKLYSIQPGERIIALCFTDLSKDYSLPENRNQLSLFFYLENLATHTSYQLRLHYNDILQGLAQVKEEDLVPVLYTISRAISNANSKKLFYPQTNRIENLYHIIIEMPPGVDQKKTDIKQQALEILYAALKVYREIENATT